MIKHFAKNTAGKDYVVGDIHGCFSRLQGHLDRIGFDPTKDRLFSVGDLVDRGPESDLCLEWLAKPWFHPVQGNHEDMAVWYASGNLDVHMYNMNGGAWMIGRTQAERMEYAVALGTLPYAIEVDTETEGGLVGIVHADCPVASWDELRRRIHEQTPTGEAFRQQCLWSRDRINGGSHDTVEGVRAVIVGHTPVERFTSLGNVLYIDTGAVFRGRDFTILDLEALRPVHTGARLDWA